MAVLLKGFEHILVPEMNTGQLKTMLRDQFLVDARPLNKVSGQPFTIAEIAAAIDGVGRRGMIGLRLQKAPEKPSTVAKLSQPKAGFMKPINAFPYIAMLVIVVLLILMFGGYFQ